MVVIDSNNSILYYGILWNNSMEHYYITVYGTIVCYIAGDGIPLVIL